MGVAYLFCRHYVPVWFNTTISLEVTKMLYLFWTDQPQPAYRRGVYWGWERRVVYTCVSHWGWKSGLGSSLLRSVGCCCCIGDHCPWGTATTMQQWVFSTRGACSCFWSTWTAAVRFIWLSCAYRSRGCYAGTRGSLSFLSTASGVLNDLSTPLSVLLICSSLELSWWDNPIFTFSQPYLMLAFPVKANRVMIKDKSK